MNQYPLDQPIELTTTVKARNPTTGLYELADPTGLTLKIQPLPGGAVTTVVFGSLTRVSLGVYLYIYSPPAEGLYGYSWKSTGVGAGYTDKGRFKVLAHTVGT